MITIISGTNRPNSYTAEVAELYFNILRDQGVDSQVLSLTQLPKDFIFSDLYDNRSDEMRDILRQYVENVHKFVVIAPEYNGSFPGVLKVFLDAVPPRFFRDKKVGLVGVSSGHAGNLRGLEHLTGIFHYLKVHVHYNKLKLSHVDERIQNEEMIESEDTRQKLGLHAKAIASF